MVAAATVSPLLLVALGVVVHATLMFSVIDIHFRSPIVSGVDLQPTTAEALAKRVVLIVADGLRADVLFEPSETGKPRAEFLHGLVSNGEAAWGVSVARPPTESRPGHVSMLAGFYEDPSALLTGWKMNVVPFDSVLNRSSFAVGLGSPDVVPMFSGHGAYTHQEYSPDLEDFGLPDLSFLDTWVFDRVPKVLDEANGNSSHPLSSGPALLFLHLLGIDSNGHAGGSPHTRRYHNNINVVDKGVASLVADIEERFPDQGTAYLFTADHGMTDHASHGDGAQENVRTPLVAWGAGLSAAASRLVSPLGGRTLAWGSRGGVRIDQAQLAPLMSALLGIPCPVNNVGLLPVELLLASDQLKSRAALANTRQLLSSFRVQAERVRSHSLRFVPFGPLEDDGNAALAEVEVYLEEGSYMSALASAQRTGRLAVEGLAYLQSYNSWMLTSVVVLGYAGWMAFTLQQLISSTSAGRLSGTSADSALRHCAAQRAVNAGGFAVAVASAAFLWATSAPATYFAYFAVPCVFWPCALHGAPASLLALSKDCSHVPRQRTQGLPAPSLLASAVPFLVVVVILELIVQGYQQRALFAVATVIAAGAALLLSNGGGCPAWQTAAAFCATGAFTLLPITQKPQLPWMVALSALPVLAAPWLLRHEVQRLQLKQRKQWGRAFRLLYLSASLAAVLVVLPLLTSHSLGWSKGLGWGLFLVCPCLPALTPSRPALRALSVFLGLLPGFMLVSLSWEPMFLWSLAAASICWADTESGLVVSVRLAQGNSRAGLGLTGLFRIGTAFLLLVNVAFFGVGNTASVSSFDVPSCYRLTTLFNPFVMGGIMMAKHLMPLLGVAAVLGILLRRLGARQFDAYLAILLLADAMCVRFFFQVQNTGSWAEMGASLSRFGVMNAQVIFVLLLLALTTAYGWGIVPTTALAGEKRNKL